MLFTIIVLGVIFYFIFIHEPEEPPRRIFPKSERLRIEDNIKTEIQKHGGQTKSISSLPSSIADKFKN